MHSNKNFSRYCISKTPNTMNFTPIFPYFSITTFIFKFFSVHVTYFLTLVWLLSCLKYLFYAFNINYFLHFIFQNITNIYLDSLDLYKTFFISRFFRSKSNKNKKSRKYTFIDFHHIKRFMFILKSSCFLNKNSKLTQWRDFIIMIC